MINALHIQLVALLDHANNGLVHTSVCVCVSRLGRSNVACKTRVEYLHAGYLVIRRCYSCVLNSVISSYVTLRYFSQYVCSVRLSSDSIACYYYYYYYY
jgi:hypothetical protein